MEKGRRGCRLNGRKQERDSLFDEIPFLTLLVYKELEKRSESYSITSVALLPLLFDQVILLVD